MQDTELSAATEEAVSETIPEEEEHVPEVEAVVEEAEPDDVPDDESKHEDSDNSYPDSPIIEKTPSTLNQENPIFREVTVSGGD